MANYSDSKIFHLKATGMIKVFGKLYKHTYITI